MLSENGEPSLYGQFFLLIVQMKYLTLPIINGNNTSNALLRDMKVHYQCVGVGLVISRSLVQFLTGALWSILRQDSLIHVASVYPAVKLVPSINNAGVRACVLQAALEYPLGN